MTTVKITLSADDKLVREMKRVARKRETSVSALFSKFAKSLIDLEEEKTPRVPQKVGPITRASLGIVKLPKGKTADQIREEAVFEKYGIKK